MKPDETEISCPAVLIYVRPDDGLVIENGIRRPLHGPSFDDPRAALRMAVDALDSGKYPDAIGATCERGQAE